MRLPAFSCWPFRHEEWQAVLPEGKLLESHMYDERRWRASYSQYNECSGIQLIECGFDVIMKAIYT